MKKSVRRLSAALLSAVMLAQPVLAAQDYYVVVPVPGRTRPAMDVSLVLNSGALPGGVVGQPYVGFDFGSTLQVTGDTSFNGTGVSWSAAGLPAGLVLSAAGSLSGAPTQTFNGQVQVTATYRGATQVQTFPLTVTEDTSTPVETAPEAPSTGGSETIVEGQAVLTVSPTSVNFGTVARMLDSAPIPVTVANTGTAPAPLVVGPPLNTQFKHTHNCPATLAVGTSCVVQVVANLTSSSRVSSFPVTLGTKVVSVALTAKGADAAVTLTHEPALVTGVQKFGTIAVGQFATAKTTLKNVGAYYPLALASAGMTTNATVGFSVAHDCPALLAPGASCVVTSKYAPTAAGTHSGTVRLTMNVSGEFRYISLSGVGAGSLAVTALNFAGAELAGGGTLTVTGSGFMPGAKVFFDNIEAQATYSSTTSLSAIVPSVSVEGDTWVRVVNPDGSSATAATAFKRSAAFVKLPSTPLDFGNQPVGMYSSYKAVNLTNAGYFTTDTFTISGIQVTGPYELYSSPGYCAVGSVLSKTGVCTLRMRFKPLASGTQPGQVTVQGNGTSVTLALTGTGSGWDAVPSSSGTANTEVDVNVVLSGNEGVGGSTLTSPLDIFLRNNSGTGQVAASFRLEHGTAVKMTTIYKTAGTNPATTGCTITGGVQTALCLADLVGSGTRTHLQVRLTATSAAGVGSFEDTLIVSDAMGVEQYRIPVVVNVVYNVTAEVSSTFDSTVALPPAGLSFGDAPLATESFKDVYLRNVGTNGMMLTRSVKLLNAGPELYLKSGVSLYTASNSGTVSACSTFINANEVTNCLADDVNGGLRPHARIRVYFKPLVPGTYAGTLLVDQSGSDTPLEIKLDAGAPGATQVFALTPSATTAATIPELVVAENYSVDGTNTGAALVVYINKTGGAGLVTGYLDLPEYQAGKLLLMSPTSLSPAGSGGYACAGTGAQTSLCSTTSYYSNLKVTVQAYASLGEGTYTATLRFLDPAKNEVMAVPISVRVVNDATATTSSSPTSAVALPGDVLNIGTATLATAPGQVSASTSKTVYTRNTGSYGKLKVSRAVIEGGDGAFSFSTNSPLVKVNTSSTPCGATRVSGQEVTNCVANDPANSYQHISSTVVFTPTQPGVQTGTLSLWHNSKVAPNPLVVNLQGTSQQVFVAGEMSTAASSTSAPTGTFTTLSSTTNYKDMTFYVRNPGAYGALYAEDLSVSGSDAFRFVSVYKSSGSGSTTSCGSVVAGDLLSSSPCLADSPDVSSAQHIRIIVRCYPASSGTFAGQLRVLTQGKEHLLPLSCAKN